MLAVPANHWTHRIDAVPLIGRHVQFRLISIGRLMMGTVVPATAAEQSRFKGIGSEIVYQCNGCRYLSSQIDYWRYR